MCCLSAVYNFLDAASMKICKSLVAQKVIHLWIYDTRLCGFSNISTAYFEHQNFCCIDNHLNNHLSSLFSLPAHPQTTVIPWGRAPYTLLMVLTWRDITHLWPFIFNTSFLSSKFHLTGILITGWGLTYFNDIWRYSYVVFNIRREVNGKTDLWWSLSTRTWMVWNGWRFL